MGLCMTDAHARLLEQHLMTHLFLNMIDDTSKLYDAEVAKLIPSQNADGKPKAKAKAKANAKGEKRTKKASGKNQKKAKKEAGEGEGDDSEGSESEDPSKSDEGE